ncbi:MAG TPA: hypothetical protein VFV38_47600 [Ktedonobacteraceae bacterium]|nr:hypothetical protein [Ktedonobacteraceae bacterium]
MPERNRAKLDSIFQQEVLDGVGSELRAVIVLEPLGRERQFVQDLPQEA